MAKAISYSLFGFERQKHKDCFDFRSYLIGLMINVRFNRVIYPEWTTYVNTDEPTYKSKYKPIFDWLLSKGLIELAVHAKDAPLTLAMLWRLHPVFEREAEFTSGNPGWDKFKFTHVICRDIDSVCTYREAQAVQQWILEDKTIHCITDSISHGVPMMGGMIGIRPQHFAMRMKVNTWPELINLSIGINFTNKGADQDFLNRFVYPTCADSSTEHFILGMKRDIPEGAGRYYSIKDIVLEGVPDRYKVSNECVGHIGAAGYYPPQTVKFLNEVDQYKNDYRELELQWPNLFFWNDQD